MEETPKGWFITYIDRDSETLFKEKQKNKRMKADMAEEEKQEREIQKQIERAAQMMPTANDVNPDSGSEPVREVNLENGIKIGFSISKQAVKEKGEASRVIFDEAENERANKRKKDEKSSRSALEELMKEELKAKERSNRKDYWLCEGIVVKVMNKTLADGKYYKQKGVVRKVIDRYTGEIGLLESKDVLKVDQEELETVIPQIGGLVRIVNGAYRGSIARLLGINTDEFCAKVQIDKGIYDGRVVPAIAYEDICKVHTKVG